MERGTLRVYLGAAPGVGKTFAMLDEGRRRQDRGTDVVVGLVETHGRPRTAAAVEGLEVVPRRTVVRGDLEVGELDVEAVLARRPEVVLVDELAHTDADGGRKRWEDVERLRAAGIDVISTVNVQHLESLNDVVAAVTGIRQLETVPDAVVRSADAIELVDMSPQALRRRMAHGNIYPPERIDAALGNFFREGNLTALRELALLWLADQVDEGLERYRTRHRIAGTWAARERVVVGVSGTAESQALMRRAARIAGRTAGGEWVAVHVGGQDGLSGLAPGELERLRTMALELGGGFHAVVAQDRADGLLAAARGLNATQILVGASRRGRLATAARPGVGERVIAGSGDIDVHVVTHHASHRRFGRSRPVERSVPVISRGRAVAGYLLAVLGTAAVSGLLLVVPDATGDGVTTEALIMMPLVVATALVGGLRPAVLAAVLSALSVNLLFVEPVGTLAVANPSNALGLIIFLVVAGSVATVVHTAARRTAEAVRARAEANALSVLAHRLLRAGDDPAAVVAEARHTFAMTGAAVIDSNDDGPAVVVADGDPVPGEGGPAATVELGAGTRLELYGPPLDADDQSLLTAYAAHLRVLRERQQAAEAHLRAEELSIGDRTRTALLTAVSHDLRSPIAAITVAIDSLRAPDLRLSDDDRAELEATIAESTARLDALVANLLDLSRLQTGAVRPRALAVDPAEAVAAALSTLATVPDTDRVRVRVPSGLPPVRADPGLLERVIANLVENALRYGPGRPVLITADLDHRALDRAAVDRRAGDVTRAVALRVVDRGPGVPTRDHETIFAPFRRHGDVPAGDGVGLGLAVARGLTEAMGGTLRAEDTTGGGLTMIITLPVDASGPDEPDPGDDRTGPVRSDRVPVEVDGDR